MSRTLETVRIPQKIELLGVYLDTLKEDLNEEIKPSLSKIYASYGENTDSNYSISDDSIDNDIDQLLMDIETDVATTSENNQRHKEHIKAHCKEAIKMLGDLTKLYVYLSEDLNDL